MESTILSVMPRCSMCTQGLSQKHQVKRQKSTPTVCSKCKVHYVYCCNTCPALSTCARCTKREPNATKKAAPSKKFPAFPNTFIDNERQSKKISADSIIIHVPTEAETKARLNPVAAKRPQKKKKLEDQKSKVTSFFVSKPQDNSRCDLPSA